MCLRIRRRSRGRFVEPVSAPAVTHAAVMSRYLRPPNTSLFVRNVADDTRYVQGRYCGPTQGGRRNSERTCAAAAARGAGGGDGAKMAGPAPVFGPELGHAAGSTTAWERRRRPWSPWASAGRVAGFLSPSPSAVRDSFLLASSPRLHPQPRPTSAPH